MIKFNSCSVDKALQLPDDLELYRVSAATETLIRGINRLGELAKPHSFVYSSAYLMKFERKISDGYSHTLRVDDERPVEEISRWQIFGTINNRIANVVVEGTFYTSETNRSGHNEYLMNGKKLNHKPEYGGVTLDDIWQDNKKYEKFLNAQVISISPGWTEVKTLKSEVVDDNKD
jgi:hypothetical protein